MSILDKSAKATTITIYSLGIFVGLLHIFVAAIALTSSINADYHRQVKINYNAFAKSLLNIHEFTSIARLAFYLRAVISSSQIVFGAFLISNDHFGSIGQFGQFAKVGNVGLLLIDIIVLGLQLSVKTPLERLAPTIVFCILLLARLIIVEQSRSKTRVGGVKTRNAGKPKASTPKKNKNE